MSGLNRLSVLGLCVLLASCGDEPKQPAPAPAKAPAAPVQQPPQEPPAKQEPSPSAPASAPVPDKAPAPASARPSYTVRGEIVTLPGIEGTVLRLHHERIATFANHEGKVGKDSQGKPGMKPMTMGFSRAPSVSFEGLKPGDKIEIAFEVNWDALGKDDNLVITKLTKLAPDAKLDFEGQSSISDPKPAPKPEPK